jgi:hypothetical protein
MHYQALTGNPRTAKLIDETTLVWLTLTASLISPTIEHSHEPELGVAGWPDGKWREREAERLTTLLFSQSAALPSQLDAMPLSLKKLSVEYALRSVFKPKHHDLVGEIRANDDRAIQRILSRYPFRDKELNVNLRHHVSDDFAKFSFRDWQLKLFDPALEEWDWHDFKADEATAFPSNAQAEVYVSSVRTRLTLRSSRQPSLNSIAEMQGRWQ